MGKQLEQEIEYYYDSHPTEEDLMGESVAHARLVRYLVLVLEWLFRGQACAIYDNLNFYRTPDTKERPVAPDVAVIKGVDYQEVASWKVGKTGPAPKVVFEIASKETWEKDLGEKRFKYAAMGVEEYFVYDPNKPPVWPDDSLRLRGWYLDQARGEMVEMIADADGRLWSAQLDSWLVPDGTFLRLFDRQYRPRLTEAEAQASRAEVESRRANVLAEKLRSFGINPDEI